MSQRSTSKLTCFFLSPVILRPLQLGFPVVIVPVSFFPPFLPFLQPSIHFTVATYDGLLNEFFRFVTLAESRPQDNLLSC
jgi:hypothetical protein